MQMVNHGIVLSSPSSWRAWIEIPRKGLRPLTHHRSPSSWRAWIEIGCSAKQTPYDQVALLMEGVDRNMPAEKLEEATARSPSSWRAWIEIDCVCYVSGYVEVALLMEGVDRNRLR